MGAHFNIFSGRVTSRQIEKQKQLQGGRGECYPKNFIKNLSRVNSHFSAFCTIFKKNSV